MTMSFDKEFNVGGYGIDTPLERSIIDYRPNIQYKKEFEPDFFDVEGNRPPEDQMGKVIDAPTVVSIWEEVEQVLETADQLEKDLSEKLKDVSVPIPDTIQNQIQEAALNFGYDISDQIPFELYKKTFEFPDSPASTVIQDVFEEYQEDVNGTLNAELYIEVVEILKELFEVREFAKKGLLAQIVPLSELDGAIDQARLERIHQKEKEMIERYTEILKKIKQNEDLLTDLMMYEYGSERHYQVQHEMEEERRKALELEKRLFTKKEIVDLLKRKASDMNEHLNLIRNFIDFDPLKDDRYEVLYHVSRQFDGKEKLFKEMKSLQAILKYVVDTKKKNVQGMKLQLRGVAGPKIRRKIQQSLINSIHVRNEVLTGVQDWLTHFDGVPDNAAFDMVARHIADGVQQSEEKYRQDAGDFYKIHMMGFRLRKEKLRAIVDKDISRQTYHLFGGMADYAKDGNVPRPNDEEFGKWLREIMLKRHSN